MKFVLVFHGEKQDGLIEKSSKIRSNPPLTVRGLEQINNLVEELKQYGPFAAIYTSRLSRALASASVLALEFGLDITTMAGLGQHASKDGSEVVYYPGHEQENFKSWQKDGVYSLRQIVMKHDEGDTILVVSHRPVIAGIAAFGRGSNDGYIIREMANDPEFTAKGYIVVGIDSGHFSWIE